MPDAEGTLDHEAARQGGSSESPQHNAQRLLRFWHVREVSGKNA